MPASTPEPLPRELGVSGLARRAAGLGLVVVVVALLVSTLPGLAEVRERFANAEPVWLVALVVLEVGSCLAYVVAFRGVFCVRLGWRFSYEIGMAEQGTNVLLPAGGVGGLALGAWALRQGGMSMGHIARRSVAFFVLTSAPNFICAAVLGCALAAGVLPGTGPLALTWALGLLALAAIVLVAVLPRILARVGPARGGSAEHDNRRARLRRLARRTAVPPFAAFVFAYVIGQLGGLIPLPGGIGGIDGGLIGALALYGSPLSEATAAVLAYRVVQLGIPAILGSVAFVQLRRTLSRDEAPAALCEPFEEPLPVIALPSR